MTSAVTLMTVTRYEVGEAALGLVMPGVTVYRSLPPQQLDSPSWAEVETAIRRMDDRRFPIVTLTCAPAGAASDAYEDEDAFNVIGGDGRWALFQMIGPWRFEDPAGSPEDDRLWESDQGYFCERRNVVTDIRAVLAMARAYFGSGRYDGLTEIGLTSRRW